VVAVELVPVESVVAALREIGRARLQGWLRGPESFALPSSSTGNGGLGTR